MKKNSLTDKELLDWIKKAVKEYHQDTYGDDEFKPLSNKQIKSTLKLLLKEL